MNLKAKAGPAGKPGLPKAALLAVGGVALVAFYVGRKRQTPPVPDPAGAVNTIDNSAGQTAWQGWSAGAPLPQPGPVPNRPAPQPPAQVSPSPPVPAKPPLPVKPPVPTRPRPMPGPGRVS